MGSLCCAAAGPHSHCAHVDGTCGRAGAGAGRGGWSEGEAGLPASAWESGLNLSISLPASAGGVSGKEAQKRPERSRYVHIHIPPHDAHRRTSPPQSASELRRKTCVPQTRSPSSDTCVCLSSLAATQCPRWDWCASPSPSPTTAVSTGCDQQAESPLRISRITDFLFQGNPSSWVRSTLPTVLPTARLTLTASPHSMVQGTAAILGPGVEAFSWAGGVLS